MYILKIFIDICYLLIYNSCINNKVNTEVNNEFKKQNLPNKDK